MPISQELLDILVCPQCKTPVKLTPDGAGLKWRLLRLNSADGLSSR